MSHMNNLSTLIKRLEAATSRLEDMAMSFEDTGSSNRNSGSAGTAPSAPETPKSKPAPPAPPAPAAPPAADPVPPQVRDFDELIGKEVQKFADLGGKIGSLVAEQSQAVLEAFKAERTYLYVAAKAKKPNPEPPELMTDLHKASDTINNIRESNRPSPLFSHLSTVSEGIPALSWLYQNKPAEFVLEFLAGAQYFGNPVLKEYKEKDRTHVEFIQSYYQIFKSLAALVREHYPKGLDWNNESGIDAREALKQVSGDSGSGSDGSAKGVPPPPPPPPVPSLNVPGGVPPPPPPPPAAGPGSDPSDRTALLEQLNQGDDITSRLKKVDKSQMTHKNPSLRAGSTVSDEGGSSQTRSKSPAPSKRPKPESMRTRKPPRKDLEGTKWLVENFDSTGDIIEVPAQQNQSILISRCNKSVIKVSSKANAISIDNCIGLSIIVDSLVSSLEVIKCPNFALQVDGVVPTVLLDQVDSAVVYLGQASLNTEVLSSKSTSLNIMLPPKEGTDDDTKECPIPEQMKSYVKDGQVVTEIVEHMG